MNGKVLFLLFFLSFAHAEASSLETAAGLVKEVLGDPNILGTVETKCTFNELPELNCPQEPEDSKIADQTNQLFRPLEWKDIKSELTPFWAQESIGSDLLKEYPNTPGPVTVLDSGFDVEDSKTLNLTVSNSVIDHEKALESLPEESRRDQRQHGSKVSHLIGGKGPEGVASNSQVTSENFSGDFYQDIERILKERPQTKLINASTGVVKQSPQVEELSKNLQENKTIVVSCSGNMYPELNTMYGTKGIVNVGSVSPKGERSTFSQRPVDIYAPSDTLIVSRSGLRGMERFGGTSGAAPMVTGTLSRVMEFLPNLSSEEAVELMKLTGTSTHAHLLAPQLNPPMLNAYRMERVARRMKDKGIKPSVENIRKYSSMLLDFSSEIKDLKLKANSELSKRPLDCKNYEQALKILRKVALLSNENTDFLSVAEIYKKLGKNANASMYESFGNKDSNDLLKNLRENLASSDMDTKARAFQTLSDSGKLNLKDYEPIINAPGELSYLKRIAFNGFMENYPKESSAWVKKEVSRENSWLSNLKDPQFILSIVSTQARNNDYSLLQILIDQDRDKKLKLIPQLDTLLLVPLSQSGMKANLTAEAFERLSSLYPTEPSNAGTKKRKTK